MLLAVVEEGVKKFGLWFLAGLSGSGFWGFVGVLEKLLDLAHVEYYLLLFVQEWRGQAVHFKWVGLLYPFQHYFANLCKLAQLKFVLLDLAGEGGEGGFPMQKFHLSWGRGGVDFGFLGNSSKVLLGFDYFLEELIALPQQCLVIFLEGFNISRKVFDVADAEFIENIFDKSLSFYFLEVALYFAGGSQIFEGQFGGAVVGFGSYLHHQKIYFWISSFLLQLCVYFSIYFNLVFLLFLQFSTLFPQLQYFLLGWGLAVVELIDDLTHHVFLSLPFDDQNFIAVFEVAKFPFYFIEEGWDDGPFASEGSDGI